MTHMISTLMQEQRGGCARNPLFGRVLAIVEVILVFALTHVAYRALKSFTVIGRWDSGTNFVPGAMMILVTILVLVLCRRRFEAYGLGVSGWREHFSMGLMCSLVLIAVWATGYLVTMIHLDATRPPDPHAPRQIQRVAGLALIAVPAGIAVFAALRSRRQAAKRIPPVVSIPAILALLCVLPIVAMHYRQRALWIQALWLFLGAGFGEEIFFRGYIQSRVDAAFGCPVRLFGVQFGVGLGVSSVLFGFIHALNTVDYFRGRFDFGWAYGLEAVGEGILFGLIRAKTASVVPGAITHGLLDAWARIPKILLGG
ncbi:MAG: hypothetical protein C5B50_16815 [Verrucomicrobia bacterium]|nr:MAG: hypothetical protein C5B50_16815 [Verrucomicrobiota bacterium]